MDLGLVLGAGGTVGLAYHAGVLRALEQAGVVPDEADVIIGTSAGSVAAAYMRSGWSTEELWQIALGTHPSMDGLSAEELDARSRGILAPAFTDPLSLARRLVGSAYVSSRAFLRVPAPFLRMPEALQRAFPGGVFEMTEGRRRFAEELPVGWPDKPLWLCCVDIGTGRRVVLGKPGRAAATKSATASLRAAVSASCAIPGLYPPVRVAGRTLVDGGIHSTTNLDLAAKAGCRLVICAAPLAYDTGGSLPAPWTQLVRRIPARMLVDEMEDARRRGAEVLLIRPSAGELRIHGVNLMRRGGWDLVAKAAYESAARQLATDRFQGVLRERAA
ncbi:MAG TPA: patatin-like phospholipase family protein [Acidimicrobiales bacterium]|nr:patatin-like phospholipase family protein [Acidimicrobiales bacterium]